ncbi:MAG: YdcF family protein [Rhodanobacteraceae bacterium]
MILPILLSPLSFAAVIGLVLLVVWKWLPRALRVIGVVIEILLFVVMAPVGANVLVRMVESRLPAIQTCNMPTPDTIVVLSGGFDRAPVGTDDFSALDVSSLRRLFAGIALWRGTPGAQLVIAGGGDYAVPESVMLARLAQQLGVPPGAIRTERRSQTTWQNAQNLAKLSPSLPKRIWLVSSALHLPRALGAFRAAGFAPCAWSSGSLYEAPGDIGYFVPQSSSLIKAEQAIHEIIGGVDYAWRERHAAPVRSVPARRGADAPALRASAP